jgi:hypothetical protein
MGGSNGIEQVAGGFRFFFPATELNRIFCGSR